MYKYPGGSFEYFPIPQPIGDKDIFDQPDITCVLKNSEKKNQQPPHRPHLNQTKPNQLRRNSLSFTFFRIKTLYN